MAVLLTILGMLGRLTLFATLLAVPRDSRLAIVSALVSALSTAIAALLRGRVMASETERAWEELLRGIRGQDLPRLLVQRDAPDGLVTVIYSAHEVALLRGTLVPGIVGQALTLVAVIAFAFVRLPAGWLLAGVVLGVPLAVASRLSSRAQVRAQEKAIAEFAAVDRDVRALVEAGLELRAHGADDALTSEVNRAAAKVAASERRSYELGASFGLLPCAVALGVAVVPRDWIAKLSEGTGWLDVGVIGMTSLTLALGIASSLEAIAHAVPYREAFRRVVAESRSPIERRTVPDETIATLELRAVSVAYPGSSLSTPDKLDLHLARGGTVLSGPNGCGKTTAILVALGFTTPSSGSVAVNGKALSAESAASLRSRVAYIPQRSHVVPSESLAWHASLAGATDLEALCAACRKLGLAHRLGPAGRELETRMGTLSGGERQRFLIARALSRGADVLILDEPEVGLDARGREELRAILEAEAATRIVLLVAHDASIAPKDFRRIACSKRVPKPAPDAVLT